MIVVIIGFVIYQATNFADISLLGLLIGSIIPDFLGPAFDRHPRDLFASKRITILLSALIIVLFIISLEINAFYWPFFILLGYLIHLVIDFITVGLYK